MLTPETKSMAQIGQKLKVMDECNPDFWADYIAQWGQTFFSFSSFKDLFLTYISSKDEIVYIFIQP